MDGRAVLSKTKEDVAEAIKKEGIKPCLAIISVGDNPASKIYVQNKIRDCDQCGIKTRHYPFAEDTPQEYIINMIKSLNDHRGIDGIICQLPLPAGIDEEAVACAISPDKDVDGANPLSVGKLLRGNYDTITACTPLGIIALLNHYEIPVEGKNVVIVGRSNIVGRPMAALMISFGATVTVCNSKTHDLEQHTKNADILICAVGKQNFITEDMVKPGAIVIDVGINRGADGRLHGDVDFDAVSRKASYITPVPGGIGQTTRAGLLMNILDATMTRPR